MSAGALSSARRLTTHPRFLSLVDFLGYADCSLDLSDVHTVAITGPVGSGKTSIIEALTFLLFGEARGYTLDDLIREGADTCSVSGDIEVDGALLTVTRTRSRGRDSVLSLAIDGVQWTGHTSRETQAEIVRRIGADYRSLLAGPLMVQFDDGALMRVAPRERRDLLSSLLVDGDRWARWAEVAKERRDAAAAEVRVADGVLRSIVAPADGDWDAAFAYEADQCANWRSALEDANARLVAAAEDRDVAFEALARAEAEGAAKTAAAERLDRVRKAFAEAKARHEELLRRMSASAGAPDGPVPPEVDATSVEEAARAYAEAAAKVGTLSAQLNAIERVLDDAHRGREVTCPQCGKVFRPGVDESHVAELTAERADHVKRLADVEATLEPLRVTAKAKRDALDARRAWERKRDQMAESHALLRESEASAHADVVRLSEEGRAAKAEAEGADDVAVVVAQARTRRDATRARLVEASIAKDDAQHSLTEAERRYDAVRDARARWTAETMVLAEAEGRMRIHTLLTEAFGRNGAPAMLLDAALAVIEDGANEVLSRMPGGFRLTLTTQRTTAKGTAAETLDVLVDPGTGRERPYGMLSGGQRFRVDLALRLGLSRVLAARRIDTLIVDEGFDRWQDPEGRGAVLDTLASVADDFALVLVVSHHPEVVERMESRIEVRMVDGVSIAEVAA